MNEGIHLDLDTWIVPGQIRTANLCRGLGNRYTPFIKSNTHNCVKLYITLPWPHIPYMAVSQGSSVGWPASSVACLCLS